MLVLGRMAGTCACIVAFHGAVHALAMAGRLRPCEFCNGAGSGRSQPLLMACPGNVKLFLCPAAILP